MHANVVGNTQKEVSLINDENNTNSIERTYNIPDLLLRQLNLIISTIASHYILRKGAYAEVDRKGFPRNWVNSSHDVGTIRRK